MPSPDPKKPQISLAKKLGAKLTKAHNAHKDKPPEVGNARLPAGIEGGVARLVSLKIDAYKTGDLQGQPYFMGRGMVVTPETHNGTPVKGLSTQLGPIPLCDTPNKSKKTFEEHYAVFLNALKLLGVDTAATEGDMTPEQVDEFLMGSMAELTSKDNPPTYFLFRTWKGQKQEIVQRGGKWYVMQGTSTKGGPYASKEEAQKKNPYAEKEPQVTEEWNGRCDFEEQQGEAPVDDGTGGEPPADEAPPDDVIDETAPAEEAPTEEASAEGAEEIDFDSLVAVADKDPGGKTPKGKEACKKLIDLGLAAGLDKETITNADNWAAVAEMIKEASAGGEGDSAPSEEEAPAEEEAPPEEDTKPVKGSVVKWCWKGKDGKPMKDAKSKKPLKPTDHEILTVSEKNETVTLKNLTSEKTVIGSDKKPAQIKWSELES